MNICLLNNLYKPYIRGGAERVVETYFNELKKRGHQVRIITTEPYLNKKDRISEVFYIKSFFPMLSSIPVYLRFFWHIWDFFDFVSAYKIWRILKNEKVDLVITHNIKGLGFLSLFVIKLLKIKHIHVLHDIQLLHPSGLMNYGEEWKINTSFAKIYQKFSLFFFSFVQIVISPSNWLLEEHKKKGFFGKAKLLIMRNPFNIENSSFDKIEFDNENFKFLYVGQIEQHKGVFFLIDSFLAHNFGDNVQLNIIGEDVSGRLDKIDCHNIKFWGKKRKEEVLTHMKNANCLIVPSSCYENSPNVIYEAYSVALPVLGTNQGGVKELINDFGGVQFSVEDKKSLIDKMLWCIENKKKLRRIGEIGQSKINKINIDNYFKSFEKLF